MMVGVPPTNMYLAGATPPPSATPTSSGPPSPPPSGRGAPTPPLLSAKTETVTGTAGLRRLWEREQGPPQPAGRETQWSSSSSSSAQRQNQPREKNSVKNVIQKLSKKESSGRRKKEDKEERNQRRSSSSSSRSTEAKNISKPSSKLSYLVGELETRGDLLASTGATQSVRESSSSSTGSTSSTSLSFGTAMLLLPPARQRSLSPNFNSFQSKVMAAPYVRTNISGTQLNILKREDDRSRTRVTNERGPADYTDRQEQRNWDELIGKGIKLGKDNHSS
jgi:hypothetical protein